MTTFRLPAATQIGHAHLHVPDLARALQFYQELLGFKIVAHDADTVTLSATGALPAHLKLTVVPNAKPRPPFTTGLFHIAIRYANRRELAHVFRRLLEQRWPFQGFSDHLVSEALYLADPEGNGIELYADRPRQQWRWQNGFVEMATEPLDLENLLREAETATPWRGVPPDTDIGHMHLQVSDLARAEKFYCAVLGFEVVQRSYPGALFISAGGYHHHIGLNIWASRGAPPPPPQTVGLRAFSLLLPHADALAEVQARLQQAALEFETQRTAQHTTALLVRDQDGNGVEIFAHD